MYAVCIKTAKMILKNENKKDNNVPKDAQRLSIAVLLQYKQQSQDDFYKENNVDISKKL